LSASLPRETAVQSGTFVKLRKNGKPGRLPLLSLLRRVESIVNLQLLV
jgi:hypothetical protein